MNSERTVKGYVALADHYLAIGQDEIYLMRDADAPWEMVTSVEGGSLHRLEIATSVSFKAKHPCGLSFRWSFDLEEREANGRAGYMMRVKEIERVLSLMPPKPRAAFKNILADTAAAIAIKAREWSEGAANQKAQADALARASR